MTPKKYYVYKHTIVNTKKSYIGYTEKGVMERLYEHFKNAHNGMDTYFYRALRKYGPLALETEVLYEGYDRQIALNKEKEHIKSLNTLAPNGYNSNEGGSGGNNQIAWDNIKRKRLHDLRSAMGSGSKNPNYNPVSDDIIIQKAIEFFNEVDIFSTTRWAKYAKSIGLPASYQARARFGGEQNIAKVLMKHFELHKISYNKDKLFYKKINDKECNKKISQTLKKYS